MEKTYPIKSIRQLKQHKKKFIRTRTGALAITLMICISFIASAALLQYYAKITMTVDIAGALMADGKEPPAEITDTIPDEVSPAGQTFCFHHWLKSNTPVPLGLIFNTTFTPSGNNITVNVYDMKNNMTSINSGLNGTQADFINFTKTKGAYFGWKPLLIQITHKNATANKTGFTLRMPRPIENKNNDYFEWYINTTNATLIIRFEGNENVSAPLNHHWRWRYSPGNGTYLPLEALSWMSATGTVGSENLTVLIWNDRLGNRNGTDDDLGRTYKYNLLVSLDTKGFIGDGYITIMYPDPNDLDVYANGYIGILTNHINMLPSEQEHLFYICYKFDVSIPPGTYIAQTTIKAAP